MFIFAQMRSDIKPNVLMIIKFGSLAVDLVAFGTQRLFQAATVILSRTSTKFN